MRPIQQLLLTEVNEGRDERGPCNGRSVSQQHTNRLS
jgi:hypothetical protein